jgi:hypothetical protein
MPPKQQPRMGLQLLRDAGIQWQQEKISDLYTAFGERAIVGNVTRVSLNKVAYKETELQDSLSKAFAGAFIVESAFDVGGEFKRALEIADYCNAHNLSFERLRPDILQVLPAGTCEKFVQPDGRLPWLAKRDRRLPLQVIDVKLTAGMTPSYFAEVAYYSMALAGWLLDYGFDKEFVVAPQASLWPGSHEASNLVKKLAEIQKQGQNASVDELRLAFQEDLVTAPLEVSAGRVKKFLSETVPFVLSKQWASLPIHVDSRCKGCDYVGHSWHAKGEKPTWHADHCIPTTRRLDHLSRVSFLSRGASTALQDEGIRNTSALAALSPESKALSSHHSLRTSRYIVPGRAKSLQLDTAFIPAKTGTSGVMPRRADLHLYVTANFDIGSAITLALGLEAFWVEPYESYRARGPREGPRNTHHWPAVTFIVDQKDLREEEKKLLQFLEQIKAILEEARELDKDTSLQVYVWDSLEHKHLMRIVGRHLAAILTNQTTSHLAWLFPPKEVLRNPVLETRKSPITVVKPVVQSLLAAPVEYYYTLFKVARAYHDSSVQDAASLHVHPHFDDPLSDQIPSERAHEIWAYSEGRAERKKILIETVCKQLTALRTITKRLEADLSDKLQLIAPKIDIKPFPRQSGISLDGQLWYGFARLDAALDSIEKHNIRAMAPHEREAKFASARLIRRITGQEASAILVKNAITPHKRPRVYEMSDESKEVKLKPRDYNFALAPEAIGGFLDYSLIKVTRNSPLEPTDDYHRFRVLMEQVTGVEVLAIDRDNRVIVLEPTFEDGNWLDNLEYHHLADFSRDVMLDPKSQDSFTKKLYFTLKAIGNPPNARDDLGVKRATGRPSARSGKVVPRNPAGDVLWSAESLEQANVERNLEGAKNELENSSFDLDGSQWDAWRKALTKRLLLIWGPPGTGKSRTLEAIALAAILEARQASLGRILICAPTYNAVDNVLLKIYDRLQQPRFTKLLPADLVKIRRIRSKKAPKPPKRLTEIDVEVNVRNPSTKVKELFYRLQDAAAITLVAGPPEQVYNLLQAGCGSATAKIFDLIMLDEASQMDVAHSILPIGSLAENGTLVVAGDPMQLPPIQQATPPAGLEAMVGSIFTYFENHENIQPVKLQKNYRSNSTIVEFAHEAGYDRALSSVSPNLRINLVDDVPQESAAPPDWPVSLYWTKNWRLFLDPWRDTVCFVYPEGKSGQSNRFEADTIAALVFLLFGRLGRKLRAEVTSVTRGPLPAEFEPYETQQFWRKGVGIVTPHRAQQALVINRLQEIFAPLGVEGSLIREAVDTVERFQGQERDIMIASYALGDPDAIRDEDEFLMSLNRFNVMVSRSRAKMITLVSQEIVDHLPRDIEVLKQSRLLKIFAESFCSSSEQVTVGYLDNGLCKQVDGVLKYR